MDIPSARASNCENMEFKIKFGTSRKRDEGWLEAQCLLSEGLQCKHKNVSKSIHIKGFEYKLKK